ncbi:MAG: MATE family efflux transporter [Trueperaceae bacterium]|nr:MATE family efflux transporter [Trueperaceae bacterium]MCO5175241.1 MATE family efflux transporter [Trueperaceae bacterium]
MPRATRIPREPSPRHEAAADPLFPSIGRLLGFAVPVTLAGVSVPLMGLLDIAVLGRLGDPAIIAGVGVAGTVLTAVLWCFSFLRFTTTGLVAQAVGRDDRQGVALQGLRPMVAAMAGGIALWLLQGPILSLGLTLIAPEPEVAAFSRAYFEVRVWGAPLTLTITTMSAWFMGQGAGRTVMLVQFFLNGLNAVLTLVLVLGLGRGVVGAAGATVLAELATVIMVVVLALRRLPLSLWRQPWSLVFERRAWRQLFAANADIVVRTLLLTICIALITERGARFGTLTLAANQVLLQTFLLVANLLDGVAIAAEVFVGRAVGAANAPALRHVVGRSAVLALAWGGLIALLVAPAAGFYLPLMTVSPELVEEARRYWPWMALLPLVSVWAFLADGIFFGSLRTWVLRNAMIVAALLYVAALLGLGAALGNHGLWLSLGILMAARTIAAALAWPTLVREVAGRVANPRLG